MKKIVSLVCLLILVIFSSCSNIKEEINTSDSFADGVMLNSVKAEYFDMKYIPIDYSVSSNKLSSRDAVYTDDGIYILGLFLDSKAQKCLNEYFEDDELFSTFSMPVDENLEPCVFKKYLCMYDFEGNIRFSLCLDDMFGPFYEWPVISVNSNGDVIFIVTQTALTTFETTYTYCEVDKNGTVLETTILDFDEFCYIKDIEVNDSGIYVYSFDENYMPVIHVFFENGIIKEKYDSDAYNVQELIKIDDDVYAKQSIFQQAENNIEYSIIKVDELNAPNERIELDVNEIIEPMSIPGGFVFKQYTENGVELSYYSLVDNVVYSIVNTSEAEFVISTYCYIGSNGEVITLGNNGIDDQLYLAFGYPTNENPNADKEVIVLAGIGISEDACIKNLVFQYNISHNESYIEVLDYGKNLSNYSSIDELSEDVINDLIFNCIDGNMPDILVCVNDELPFYSLTGAECFVDLKEYIDFTSVGLNPIIESVLTSDGSVYSVPSCYSISGIVIDSDFYTPDWTMESFYGLEAKAKENQYVSVLCGYSSEEYLKCLLNAEIASFFDVSTGIVNFDSDEFVSVLEWSKYNGQNENIGIKDKSFDNINLISKNSCASVVEINSFALMGADDSDCYNNCFVGFPSKHGEKVVAIPKYSFAITKDCTNVENAKDLLLLSWETNMQNVYSRMFFPVINDSFDLYMSSLGGERTKKLATDIVNNISCIYQNEPELIKVVLEESRAYFCGQKSAKDVVLIIQSKAEIIMSERYESE